MKSTLVGRGIVDDNGTFVAPNDPSNNPYGDDDASPTTALQTVQIP